MGIPSFSQPSVSGKLSWFGGPGDATDSGRTASGGTTAEPGIAVYNRATLGGYWRVTTPNGKTVVLKQTDLGPAPFTGRKIDVTYSALAQLGYNEHNFPTDSVGKAEYLGKNPTGASKAPAVMSPTPGTTQSFNKGGYEQAVQKAAGIRQVASLFTGNKPGDIALRGALEHAGTPPTEQDYTSTSIAKTPTGTFYTPSSNGQYVHPLPGARIGRTDMGVDASAAPGTPIRAIGDSKVLEVQPNWYKGQPYVSLELQSGPHAGKIYYVAEQISPGVHAGQFVRGGHAIGHVASQGTGLEMGWGSKGGKTLAQATTGYSEGAETSAGKNFAGFLKGLH